MEQDKVAETVVSKRKNCGKVTTKTDANPERLVKIIKKIKSDEPEVNADKSFTDKGRQRKKKKVDVQKYEVININPMAPPPLEYYAGRVTDPVPGTSHNSCQEAFKNFLSLEEVSVNEVGVQSCVDFTPEEFSLLLVQGSEAAVENVTYVNEVVVTTEQPTGSQEPPVQEEKIEREKTEEVHLHLEKLEAKEPPSSSDSSTSDTSSSGGSRSTSESDSVDLKLYASDLEYSNPPTAMKETEMKGQGDESSPDQRTLKITRVENEEQLLEELLKIDKDEIDKEEEIQRKERREERARQIRYLDDLMKLIQEAKEQI